MKKIIYAFLPIVLFSSCTDSPSLIKENVVVDRIEILEKRHDCSGCIENEYSFKVQLKARSGQVFYYTNFRHDVGYTLLSLFELNDDRKSIELQHKKTQDSLILENERLMRKVEELVKYNEILLSIIEKSK